MPHRAVCSFVITCLCRGFSCVHGRAGGAGRVCLIFLTKITLCWRTHQGQEMKAVLDVAAHTEQTHSRWEEKKPFIGTT